MHSHLAGTLSKNRSSYNKQVWYQCWFCETGNRLCKKQTQESGTENVGKSLYHLKTAWRQDSFKIDLNVHLNPIRLFILTAVEMYGPTKFSSTYLSSWMTRISCFPLYVEVIFMPIRRLYWPEFKLFLIYKRTDFNVTWLDCICPLF